MNIKPLINPRKRYRLARNGLIIGYWNEDDSPFMIQCPEQLQKLLVNVLNNLGKIDEKKILRVFCKDCIGNPDKCKKDKNLSKVCYDEKLTEAKMIVKYLIGK